MKFILSNTIISFLAMVIMIALPGCNEDNTSGLRLDGDTYVTSFTVDKYDGAIDNTEKTITVSVPEVYNTDAMEVTALTLSDGASSSIQKGDKLNLSVPQVLTVINGDVYQDYTIKVKHDEAKITSFKLNDTYIGAIDETNHKITVRVPSSQSITNLVPSVVTSMDAIVSPVPGTGVDFTNPVEFTVTYNTASAVYVVTVIQTDAPEYIYVGLSATLDDLNPEEKTAATWMINTYGAQYVPFSDISSGNVDISKCKVMWWHLHIDGGIDNMDKFDEKASAANNAAVKMKDYMNNGGGLLLTRYATYYAVKLGITKDGRNPNNCWGQVENNAETTGGAWSFSNKGHESHPLYSGLKDNDDSNVYTCDANYRITNSTAQWHIGSDWGGYATLSDWRDQTGATDLGYGGDGAVVVWEYPTDGNRGGVLCIGSGCYDWYAVGMDSTTDKYHVNVETMTKNAIDYLKGNE